MGIRVVKIPREVKRLEGAMWQQKGYCNFVRYKGELLKWGTPLVFFCGYDLSIHNATFRFISFISLLQPPAQPPHHDEPNTNSPLLLGSACRCVVDVCRGVYVPGSQWPSKSIGVLLPALSRQANQHQERSTHPESTHCGPSLWY